MQGFVNITGLSLLRAVEGAQSEIENGSSAFWPIDHVQPRAFLPLRDHLDLESKGAFRDASNCHLRWNGGTNRSFGDPAAPLEQVSSRDHEAENEWREENGVSSIYEKSYAVEPGSLPDPFLVP